MEQLESIKNSNTIKIENISASLSTVKDADLAFETANMVRSQILQKAS